MEASWWCMSVLQSRHQPCVTYFQGKEQRSVLVSAAGHCFHFHFKGLACGWCGTVPRKRGRTQLRRFPCSSRGPAPALLVVPPLVGQGSPVTPWPPREPKTDLCGKSSMLGKEARFAPTCFFTHREKWAGTAHFSRWMKGL